MKRSILIAAIAVLQVLPVFAARTNWITKEKKVHRQFTVQATDQLAIDNTFGDIQINTWDKNEITVDITIVAKSRSEAQSQDMLDHVELEEKGANTHRISFFSAIESGFQVSNGDELHTKYIVYMPRRNNVEIVSKFGNVTIPDMDGSVDLETSFGTLKIARLNGAENKIKHMFGVATISYIEGGKVKMEHGTLTVDKIKSVKMDNSFSKVEIGSAQNLDMAHKYGSLNIGSVGSIDGYVNHSAMEIEHLLKKADLGLNYSESAAIKSIGPDAENIKICVGYGSLECYFSAETDLAIDVKTEFGKLKNHASSKYVSMEKYKEYGNTELFKGKAGKGQGRMNLYANYSTIYFR